MVWSAAQVLTSRLSRGDQVSITQPEPPPSALPVAENSAFQRASAAEVARDRLGQRPCRLALAGQAVEVELVDDHRVGRDQLLALQPVDHEDRRRGDVERGELRGDGVQPLHRAGVVVLVMADEQLLATGLSPSPDRTAASSVAYSTFAPAGADCAMRASAPARCAATEAAPMKRLRLVCSVVISSSC